MTSNLGTETLVRQLIGGDPAAPARIADRSVTSAEPVLLAVAALVVPQLIPTGGVELLDRARAAATTTRDRQVVAIVAAHLAGDRDRVGVLARDHLADHPDNILVAWLATCPTFDLEMP